VVFVVWFFVVASFGWDTPAGASYVEHSALDAIDQRFQVPITNPADGGTWPSVLFVASANLDTANPVDSAVHAPGGQIYLSLQMGSEPLQRQYGQPHWGSFFSTMTPLPATALRYVTASGRSYVSTRANPVSQAYNSNSATDDGLVDATYYFIVPISNRRGTVVVAPSRTTGDEFVGFVGGSPVLLKVGGPTRIALTFPRNLTVAVTTTTATMTAGAGTTFASGLNLVATLIAVLLVGFILLVLHRRKNRTSPRPVFVVGREPHPSPTTPTVATVEKEPEIQPKSTHVPAPSATVAKSTLRIDVLGPLTITPVFAPASDPVRAIAAYLALNNDRVLTLEEIQNAVWPLTENGTDIKRPAMRNYMVDVRKTIGEYHLPTASGRSGYQLVDFETDWGEFQSLTSQATKARKSEAMDLRRQAMNLAKGLPFSADTSRYFTWTFSTSVVYKIIDAVTTLAHVLGTDLVLSGDLAGAQGVLRQGLLIDPASLVLWEDLTDVLLESADQSLLDLHWKTAELVLRSEDVVLLRTRANG